jgi:hypothetical protein
MDTVAGGWPVVFTPIWKVVALPPGADPSSVPLLQTIRVGVPASAAQNPGSVPAVVPAGRSKMVTALLTVSSAPFSMVML